MLPLKEWIHIDYPESEIHKIANELKITSLLAKVLLSKGMSDSAYIKKFMEPNMNELYDPFLLKDMEKAVNRIKQAINQKESIVIYGDYDVDGITSTAALFLFLKKLGAQVAFFIPDRFDEGYGLSIGAIDKILIHEPSLVITVDCGTTSFEETQYLRGKNVDVIITDHHQCKEGLPEACAVINPNRTDESYPFHSLSGVGVVFKLIHALGIRLELGDVHEEYLDLVAIGTVADIVPLLEENRIIVKHGLSKIENTKNLGLKKLLEVSGLIGKPVTSWGIGFMLAPRINAAGRTGNATRAVTLFTTKDEKQAHEIACELNEENKFRQDTEQEILKQAVTLIEKEKKLHCGRVIVVAGKGWHEGVIGIVASRITEKFFKPCIVISIEEGIGKGSGRSIEGFNLFKALTHCEEDLIKFGGHSLAAGLSITEDKIDIFRNKINALAEETLSESDLVPKLKINVQLAKEDITIENVMQIESLAPFGAGNPGPVFEYAGLEAEDIKTVGENKHLKLRLKNKDLSIDAIGFQMGGMAESLRTHEQLSVACTMEVNIWKDTKKVQLNLKDIKKNEFSLNDKDPFFRLDKYIDFKDINEDNIGKGFLTEMIRLFAGEDCVSSCQLVPDREDLLSIYRVCATQKGREDLARDLFSSAVIIADHCKITMNYFKLKKGLEILNELNLIQINTSGDFGICVMPMKREKEKAELENSVMYRKLQALKRCMDI